IDHFKNYNDHFGHQQGDVCLRQVAWSLSQTVRRATDLVARYGGEEFVVILPKTGPAGASAVAEALRLSVERLELAHNLATYWGRVTISLGVATLVPGRHDSSDRLLAAADTALYAAKRAGRNCVKVFGSRSDHDSLLCSKGTAEHAPDPSRVPWSGQ